MIIPEVFRIEVENSARNLSRLLEHLAIQGSDVALERGACFAADGKSANNVLGFPGLLKGRLQAAQNDLQRRC